eukprot:19118-Chlamydomonas_euryale.AAC.6
MCSGFFDGEQQVPDRPIGVGCGREGCHVEVRRSQSERAPRPAARCVTAGSVRTGSRPDPCHDEVAHAARVGLHTCASE